MCLQGWQARAACDAARRGEVVHFDAAAARPRRPLGRALLSSTALSGALAAAVAGASLALATGAQAQTVINVTVASDPGTNSAGTTGGPGTLSAALAQINASTPPGGFIINLQTNVTLSGPLSPIFNSVTINGNGNTISGGNSQRIFMVGVGLPPVPRTPS